MYRKAMSGLLLFYLIFLFGFLCVMGISRNIQAAVPACDLKLDERVLAERESGVLGITYSAVSEQRVMQVAELNRMGDNGLTMTLGEEDLEILLRIVEAEAGNQDADGKLLVANVVLNRVASDQFPGTVKDVVLQKDKGVCQFSPVASGRIWKVKISEETSQAVERALDGEDLSDGALYFAARKYADKGSMRWFDEHLTYLFAHGGHEFYR